MHDRERKYNNIEICQGTKNTWDLFSLTYSHLRHDPTRICRGIGKQITVELETLPIRTPSLLLCYMEGNCLFLECL